MKKLLISIIKNIVFVFIAIAITITALLLINVLAIEYLTEKIEYHYISKYFINANPNAKITDFSSYMTFGADGIIQDISMLRLFPIKFLHFDDAILEFDISELNIFELDFLLISNTTIAHIKSLNSLQVRNHNQIAQINFINIKELNDISFLQNCSPIKDLFLNDNEQITDFSVLQAVNVENLWLCGTNLENVDDVINPHLKNLNIRFTPASKKINLDRDDIKLHYK